MDWSRRGVLGGIAGTTAVLAGGGTAMAQAAQREFAVFRGNSDIGRHRIALERDGDTVELSVDVDLVVRVLGIAAFRYSMTNRETWRDGLLIAGDSDVNNDGRRRRVITRREGDRLIVDSPDFGGAAPGDLATTTYFTPDFLEREPWLSTDSGDLFEVRASQVGDVEVETADGRVSATRWHVRDGGVFDVMLDYDARGEWISVSFDANGTPARYRPLSLDPAFGPVWRGA